MNIIIGMMCTMFGAVLSYLSYQKTKDKDLKKDTERIVSMDVKLDNIGRNVDEIRLENKDISKSVNLLSERVTIVEQSVKSAHKRLDTIEEEVR